MDCPRSCPSSPSRWRSANPRGTGERPRFFAAGCRCGIVGASLVIVRNGKVRREIRRHQDGRPAGRSIARHLSLGVDHQDLHRHRHHALRDAGCFARRSRRQLRARGPADSQPYGDPAQHHPPLMSHSAGAASRHVAVGRRTAMESLEPTEWSQRCDVSVHRGAVRAGTQYGLEPRIILLGRIIETLSGDATRCTSPKHPDATRNDRTFFRSGAVSSARSAIAQLRAHRSGPRRSLRFDTASRCRTGGLNAPLTTWSATSDLDRRPAHPSTKGCCGGLLSRRCGGGDPGSDGEGGSGSDVRVALSFFIERHRDEELVAQRQPERLPAHPLSAPSLTVGYVVASTPKCLPRRAGSPDHP